MQIDSRIDRGIILLTKFISINELQSEIFFCDFNKVKEMDSQLLYYLFNICSIII